MESIKSKINELENALEKQDSHTVQAIIFDLGLMKRRTFLKTACYGGVAALLASYPVFIERNWVQINKYRIAVPCLPKSFNGFRVVHLTDLHFGYLVSESFGLIETEKCKLFISKGIGWAIYPIRFNCYPEIAVHELTAV